MIKLQRYIGSQVLVSILMVVLVVIGLDLLFIIIGEVDNLTRQYTLTAMLSYAFLTVPSAFYEYLPLACLVGCMVGLGPMASNSELTIIRAAGVSVRRIIVMAMAPVLLMGLVAMPVGEYVAPYTGVLAEGIRAESNRKGPSYGRGGVWHRENNEYIHIRVVKPNGDIRGITRFSLDQDNSLKFSSYAKTGYQDDSNGWVLKDVTETRFYDERTEVTKYPLQPWDVALTPQRLKVLLVKPKEMSITELYSYSQYLAEQDLNSDRFLQSFWRKMLQPISIIGLVLIGISFMFGSMRSASAGLRIVTGVVVGMTFKIVQDILGPLSSVYGIEPIWSALLPIVFCFVLGGWLLKRAG